MALPPPQDVDVPIIPESGLEKSLEIRAVVSGLQKCKEVVRGLPKHERAIRALIDLLWWADVGSDVAPAASSKEIRYVGELLEGWSRTCC